MVGGFQPALVNGRGDLAPTITDNFTQMSTRPSTSSDNFCNFYVVMLSLDSNLFIGSDTINSHGMEYPMRVQKYKVVLSAKQLSVSKHCRSVDKFLPES